MDIQKIIESIHFEEAVGFPEMFNSGQISKAESIYKPLEDTQEGQKQILKDASEGNMDAVIYLYDKFKGLTRKVFYKYYLGPEKQYAQSKLDNNEVMDFLSVALSMLAGLTEPSPYKAYNPEVFSSDTNLVNQFSYYYFRYLQNEAFKLLRKNRGKNTIKRKETQIDDNGEVMGDSEEKSTPTEVSYDEYFSNSDEAATEDFSDSQNLTMIFDDFEKWLANKGEKYLDIWKMRRQDVSFADIADKLGYARPQIARNKFEIIKKWFIEKYPDLDKNN